MGFGLSLGGSDSSSQNEPWSPWQQYMLGTPTHMGVWPEAQNIYRNLTGRPQMQQGALHDRGFVQSPTQTPFSPGGAPQLAGHHMMPGGGQQIGGQMPGGLQTGMPGMPGVPQSPMPGMPQGPMTQIENLNAAAGGGFGALMGAADVQNNPYLSNAIDASIRPLFERYMNQINPGLSMDAAMSGQSPGSSKPQISQGLAQQELIRTAGDMAARMGSEAYGQGLDAVQGGMQYAPMMAGLPFAQLQAYRDLIGGPPGQGTTNQSGQDWGFTYEN